jgi:uncharacterized phage-associated protein
MVCCAVPKFASRFVDYQPEKALEVLLYLAAKVPKFDQYKACKMFFLSDKRHLVRYGRTITGDEYDALEHGPIPSMTRERIKTLLENAAADKDLGEVFKLDVRFKYPRLVGTRDADLEALSQTDLQVLNETIEEFGNKGFDELKALTHEMVAYKKAWKDDTSAKSFPMSFEDFFEQDEDAVKGTLEEMKENLQLRRRLVRKF